MLRFACFALLMLGLSTAASAATDIKDGTALVPGAGKQITPIGGSNGSTVMVLRTDADGNLRVVETKPANWQTEQFTVAADTTRVQITAGFKNLGNAWACSRFRYRLLTIYHVNGASGTPSLADSLTIGFQGSDDGVTYRDIDQVVPGAYGIVRRFQIKAGLTTAATSGRTLLTFSIPEEVYMRRFVSVYIKRDSTAASTALPSVGVSWEGRE